jgi:glycosyltransferase involved in cell wall biosynthesis
MTATSIDVVLPVLDEARAIPWVLDRLPHGCAPIVVDNGSSDGSAAIARRHGAVVVNAPQRGFGAACWTGLQAATAEIVAFMDCDASLDPAEISTVAGPVLDGRADLILGARRAEHGAWPLTARLANRLLVRAVRRRTGVRLEDLGPMRAARREALVGLGLADRRSGWPLEMVLAAIAAGWRIDEVPVRYRRRIGASKVTGTVRGTLTAAADMRRQLAAWSPPDRAEPRPIATSAVDIGAST